MKRLTKTYSDGTHGASDSLPCGENSYNYKNLLIEKLGKYEDLEERLNKVYGDCDGLLESMIELLEDGGFEEEHLYDYQDGIEVIGNIFDNPELLESEEK